VLVKVSRSRTDQLRIIDSENAPIVSVAYDTFELDPYSNERIEFTLGETPTGAEYRREGFSVFNDASESRSSRGFHDSYQSPFESGEISELSSAVIRHGFPLHTSDSLHKKIDGEWSKLEVCSRILAKGG
jgi:hypothetical protein